jgi:hypothetical protein
MLVPFRSSLEEEPMKTLLVLMCALLAAGTAGAAAPPDLLQSATHDAPLRPGVVYQATLFAPQVRITAPGPGWRGSQWVDRRYDWLVVHREQGGIAVVSAPASHHSVATTLHLLETERADSTNVGISIQPPVAVTIGGFRGQQFDGVATGVYGHTFVPFSGHSRASSGSAGDKVKYEHGKAFRIIVLDARGKPVVFFIDSDAPTIDLNFSAAATKLLARMRFPDE